MLREIYNSFVRINGLIAFPIFLVLGILPFFVIPQTKVSIGWIILIFLLFFSFLIILYDVAYRALHRVHLPKVKRSIKPYLMWQNAVAILLLEKSNLFGHESLVSVYFKENNFEILIGYGYVLAVQEDEQIQVLITKDFDTEKRDIWNNIRMNDTAILNNILVRPSIPKMMENEVV